jgi:hypothetical protein
MASVQDVAVLVRYFMSAAVTIPPTITVRAQSIMPTIGGDRNDLSPPEVAALIIRFPGDQIGLAILGHQWKPALAWIWAGRSARAAQRAEMMRSSSSRVGICRLTIGSSTRVHSVSAG